MKRLPALCAAALMLLATALTNAQPAPKAKPAAKNIDLVICLDVSGSMQGLIDSAKARLWDIVNHMAKIQPTPNLRVALYTYGRNNYDPKTGWVQKDVDLTTDLDALYQKLFPLTTNGGNEYVTRVSVAAVAQLDWSKDKDALKLIFVCGNEPATQDPTITLKQAADQANAKGIIINPIFCGAPNHRDALSWQQLAAVSGGRFVSIDHNKGAVVIAAPMDKALVELGEKLNKTYVAYGKAGEAKALNQVAQTVNAKQAGYGVAASRAIAQNSGLYRNETWDLVDKCKADPKFDITKVPEDELCESLKKLTPELRVSYVKDMTTKRANIQKQITDLTKQRTVYMQEQLRKNPNQAERAFDSAIRETLRMQAATRGITVPE